MERILGPSRSSWDVRSLWLSEGGGEGGVSVAMLRPDRQSALSRARRKSVEEGKGG